MELIFGYLLLILIGGPVVFALAGACAVRWLGYNGGDVFADWYVSRDLLIRCMPWVERELPNWTILGVNGVTGAIIVSSNQRMVTNIRQGWLPSGEEVQP